MAPRKPKVSIEEWDRRRDAHHKRYEDKLEDYDLFCRWYNGNFDDVWVDVTNEEGEVTRGQVSGINMTGLVARSWISHLYFNAPKAVVKEQPGFGPEMADVLTRVANNLIEETGLYEEGRSTLLDGFLGPVFVVKIGYSCDVTEPEDKLEEQRAYARSENQSILERVPVYVSPYDHHQAHHEIISDFIEKLIDGTFGEVPEEVIEAAKAHQAEHEKVLKREGPKQFAEIRNQRVFIRRRSPRCMYWDFTATDLRSQRWCGETYLIPREDVESNPRYSTGSDKRFPEASPSSTEISKRFGEDFAAQVEEDDIPKVLIHEMYDLINDEVVTYVDGAELPIRVVDYDMKGIMPNGPYEWAFFDSDPKDIVGVAQPSFWRDQQRDVNVMNTVEILVGKMSIPGLAYDGEYIDEREVQNLARSVLGRYIKLHNIPGNKTIEQVMRDIPLPNITNDFLLIKERAMEIIEKASLLGGPRLGGGDRTNTATASALLAEASSGITQKAAVVVDSFFRRVIRTALRLVKKYYTQDTIRKYVGEQAWDVWPTEGFTDSQILDDRGVDIVVGTMRRESTDVELKLMGDLFATIIRLPTFAQSPALQMVAMRLLGHMFNLYGAPVDISDIQKQLEANPDAFAAPPEEVRGGTPDLGQGARQSEGLQSIMNVLGGGGGAASTR